MTPQQQQEHIRWFLLAALAQQYPSRIQPLLDARRTFADVATSEHFSLSSRYVVARVLLPRHVWARLEEDEPERLKTGLSTASGLSSCDALSFAIGNWAKHNGLMETVGYRREHWDGPKIPIVRPSSWVAPFALKLLDAEVSDGPSMVSSCYALANRLLLERPELHRREEYQPHEPLPQGLTREHHPFKLVQDPYPQPPDHLAALPDCQSEREFLDEIENKFKAYYREMRAWYLRHGAVPEIERRQLEEHSRWLAWHLCDGLTPAGILEKSGRHDGDESTVTKALFGSGGIATLAGFVKEADF